MTDQRLVFSPGHRCGAGGFIAFAGDHVGGL